jgi:CheY-like chemotaxis protein
LLALVDDVTDTREPGKKKILIIDDDEDLCVLAAHALTMQRSDREVISALDGPSGIQRARAERPALIILDVMMPKMNGYEVCRCLKADPATSHIPVIMLTASSDPHLNQKAFEAGAVACLTKPYRPGTLVNCVDMALASGERARERAR